MQSACVFNQEILIYPELNHPCTTLVAYIADNMDSDQTAPLGAA